MIRLAGQREKPPVIPVLQAGGGLDVVSRTMLPFNRKWCPADLHRTDFPHFRRADVSSDDLTADGGLWSPLGRSGSQSQVVINPQQLNTGAISLPATYPTVNDGGPIMWRSREDGAGIHLR